MNTIGKRQRRSPLIVIGITALCALTTISASGAGAAVTEPPPEPPGPGPIADKAEPYGSNTWVEPPAEDAGAARLLRIELQNQQHVAGSWAAVGATIATFHGKKSTPNSFCAQAFGQAKGTKCPEAKSRAAKLPRMQTGFKRLGIVPGRLSDTPPSFAELVKEIDAGRPVAVRVHWTVGGGHMLVLYGYNAKKQQIYFADPWPTADNYQWASYHYLVKNKLWHMTGAITGIGGDQATAPAGPAPNPGSRAMFARSSPGQATDSEPYGQAEFPAQAAKTAKLLRIQQQVQRRDQWCWSASGNTIAAYFGKKMSQETFCNIARGRPAKSRNCPNEPQPVTVDQRAFRKLRIKPGVISPRAMSFQEIRAEIDRGRPALAAIRWTGGGGHALTVFGYDARQKWIFWADPWGSSPRYSWASYGYFRKNAEFAMDHALKQIGPAAGRRKTH